MDEGPAQEPADPIVELLGQVRDEIAGLRADLVAQRPAKPDVWDSVPEVDGL